MPRGRVVTQTPEERFWPKVRVGSPHECWEWIGSRDRGGYGTFKVSGRTVGAHRWYYEMECGRVPEGKELDHLCRNRACVNPAHLEPVTRRENIKRGIGPTAENIRKTHCIRGHELTPDNIASSRDGSRRCHACDGVRRDTPERREAARKRALDWYYAKKKSA